MTKEEWIEALTIRHGKDIQETLMNAKVAIAGLGGLGSHIAFMLVRSGIGHLHLIDFDRIDITNLNRQCYPADAIGQYKTERLKSELLRVNPYLDVTLSTVKLHPDNIKEILGGESLVCEAFDGAAGKAMLIETLLSQCPDTDIVSGTGMAGYDSSNLIRTRRAMKRLWICGDETNGIETGRVLMAGRVSICAGHMANMAVRLLLGQTEP